MKGPTYHCSLCEFTSRKMSELEQHMQTKIFKVQKLFSGFHVGFNSSHLYAQHARTVHSIPVFDAEFPKKPTDDKMAPARDLQAIMTFKQEQIQELIDQKLSTGP